MLQEVEQKSTLLASLTTVRKARSRLLRFTYTKRKLSFVGLGSCFERWPSSEANYEKKLFVLDRAMRKERK